MLRRLISLPTEERSGGIVCDIGFADRVHGYRIVPPGAPFNVRGHDAHVLVPALCRVNE